MFAIILDEEKYLQSYSDKFRKPESILVDAIPDEEEPEKLHCYQYINNEFVLDADKWAAIEAERAKAEAERAEAARIAGIRHEIDTLKETIESTDYQVIKCYEYSLMKLAMPYDIETLHAERQAMRDEINALEKEL